LRALANRFEHQRFRISCGVNAKDIENDGRCRPFITTADDVPITNDENQLPLVVIVQTSKGVNCATKRVLSFCVTRNLAQYEFIQPLGEALGIELKRSKDCIELVIYIVHVGGGRTFQRHRGHDHTGERKQKIILHLTSRGIPEVRLSPVESV
jgi:hypothetical protein